MRYGEEEYLEEFLLKECHADDDYVYPGQEASDDGASRVQTSAAMSETRHGIPKPSLLQTAQNHYAPHEREHKSSLCSAPSRTRRPSLPTSLFSNEPITARRRKRRLKLKKMTWRNSSATVTHTGQLPSANQSSTFPMTLRKPSLCFLTIWNTGSKSQAATNVTEERRVRHEYRSLIDEQLDVQENAQHNAVLLQAQELFQGVSHTADAVLDSTLGTLLARREADALASTPAFFNVFGGKVADRTRIFDSTDPVPLKNQWAKRREPFYYDYIRPWVEEQLWSDSDSDDKYISNASISSIIPPVGLLQSYRLKNRLIAAGGSSSSIDSEDDDMPVSPGEDLLSRGEAKFALDTLSYSTTTAAEAISMLVNFASSRRLPYAALTELVTTVNKLFAPAVAVLPSRKALVKALSEMPEVSL
ncbi:hypothetical protein HPB49_010928 [Dermacentor silvarum]|uniref:Uncharacterized protein n=1 Tax=Dermacentor silvarum TaxID=543639 RepID=A0ACB8DZF5_DERSI|nr:hypothetical protein HPB49_010928 [Dermacentor silvarum]